MDKARTALAALAAVFTALLSWKRWQATNGSIGQTAVPVVGGTVITTVLYDPALLTTKAPQKISEYISDQIDNL